ncbi:MAG: hypothetical protein JOY66_23210 [Acetobacteraceae bacterium]|nr:hypothetical protein [Acetobacteraceae bacterium]
MWLPNTPDSRALAKAVSGRIGAEARWLRAQMAQEVLIGIGALSLMLGLGAGAAFWGYSFVLDRRPRAADMAAAFAAALARTPVRGQLIVVPTGTVELDTKGATVRLDTSDVPPLSTAQLGLTGAAAHANAQVVTDYTVFKSVPYGQGAVVTGWQYDSSESPTPSLQYCYYREPGGTNNANVWYLAQDGARRDATRAPVDAAEAVRSCVWFNGRPTR